MLAATPLPGCGLRPYPGYLAAGDGFGLCWLLRFGHRGRVAIAFCSLRLASRVPGTAVTVSARCVALRFTHPTPIGLEYSRVARVSEAHPGIMLAATPLPGCGLRPYPGYLAAGDGFEIVGLLVFGHGALIATEFGALRFASRTLRGSGSEAVGLQPFSTCCHLAPRPTPVDSISPSSRIWRSRVARVSEAHPGIMLAATPLPGCGLRPYPGYLAAGDGFEIVGLLVFGHGALIATEFGALRFASRTLRGSGSEAVGLQPFSTCCHLAPRPTPVDSISPSSRIWRST